VKHTSVLTCNLRQGRTQSGEGLGAAALQPQQIVIKKKHTHFCRHDSIKRFRWFTVQPNWTTESGWRRVH